MERGGSIKEYTPIRFSPVTYLNTGRLNTIQL